MANQKMYGLQCTDNGRIIGLASHPEWCDGMYADPQVRKYYKPITCEIVVIPDSVRLDDRCR